MVKKRHYPPTYYRYYEKHKGVRFTLTTDEYEKIKEMAKNNNVSISDFMRTLVFNYNNELEKIKSTYESEIEKIKSEYETENNKLNTELNKIYKQINDVGKLVDSGFFDDCDPDYCNIIYPDIKNNNIIQWLKEKIPKKKEVKSENDKKDEWFEIAKMIQRSP